MEKISINPDRLLWCMEEFGINLIYLSRDVRIKKQTLMQAMRGRAVLTVDQLEKIADYFGRGLLFFLDPSKVKKDLIYSKQLLELIQESGKV